MIEACRNCNARHWILKFEEAPYVSEYGWLTTGSAFCAECGCDKYWVRYNDNPHPWFPQRHDNVDRALIRPKGHYPRQNSKKTVTHCGVGSGAQFITNLFCSGTPISSYSYIEVIEPEVQIIGGVFSRKALEWLQI